MTVPSGPEEARSDSARTASPPADDSSAAVLVHGDLVVRGRILPASNATFLAEATLGERTVPCVYKPVAGERPLWDFPTGTLANREVAAYALAGAIGWDLVPRTLLRDGPHGRGMVQEWRDPLEDVEPVDLCRPDEVPAGYLPVLQAQDGEGHDVTLVHEDTVDLRRLAVFDVLANNADRKGGHVLAVSAERRLGVDHGICFHEEDKLRTVLWGWAGEPLSDEERAAVDDLAHQLESASALCGELHDLLSAAEVDALRRRADRLLRRGRLPSPRAGWPPVPWPVF